MKLVLLLLGILTICHSIPILTPYRSVDVSSVDEDPVISNLIEFGADQLIKQGILDNKLPHPDFHVSKINSIQLQSLNGMNYKFDVNLKDDDGLLVNSAFTMNYKPNTDEKYLSSMTYSIRNEHPLAKLSHFETLDNSVVKDNHEIAELLQFGVQHVIEKGIHENKIPIREFRVGSLLKVQKHDLGLGSGSYYHFKVDLTDGHGTDVTTKMTLFHNPYTREREVIDTFFKVKPFTSQLELEASQNDYIDVDISSISSNQEANDALQYGYSQILQKGMADKKLPIAEYTLKTVTKAQKQTTGSGVNYSFSITISDNQSTNGQASFIVAIKSSDQTKTLTSYSLSAQTTTTTIKTIEPDVNAYQSVAIATANSDSVIQTCLNYGISEVLTQAKTEGKIESTDGFTSSTVSSVEQQTVQNYAFYRFSVVLSNNKGTTVTSTFVVVYNLSTKSPGMKSVLTKVTTTQTTTTTVTTDAEGYSTIDLLDVKSNTQIKSCMEYGVAQILERGLSTKKIPIAQYTVSNVNSASKLLIGELTNYKFDCDLTNGAGTTIRSTFTVQYNTKTIVKTLMSYSYDVKTATSTKSYAEPDETAWVEVKSVDISTNTLIQGAIDFSTTEVLKIALSASKITSTSAFKVIQISSVQKQKVKNFVFTKIQMDLGDSSLTTITVKAVVSLNTDTNERVLQSYTYEVKTFKGIKALPADSAFTTLTSTQIDESFEIQNVIDFAMKSMLGVAYSAKKVKDTNNYSVDKVTVKYATVTGGTYYKLTMTFSNGVDTSVDAICTVIHYVMGKDQMATGTYNVNVITTKDVKINDPTDDQYTTIELADVAVNSELQAGLQFSQQYILSDALEDNEIKSTEGYTIQKITSVRRAVVNKYTFYKLVITLSNDEDTTLEATIVIMWDIKTSKFLERQLKYDVTILKNVAAQITEPSDDQYIDVSPTEVQNSDLIRTILGVGTQQIIQFALGEGKILSANLRVDDIQWVKKATVKVFVFYRFSVTLTNDDDTVVLATFTVVHNTRSLENTMRRYTYNAVVTVWSAKNITEPTDDLYVSFDIEEVQLNLDIRKVFNFATDQILSAALVDGKIQNKNFNVTVIKSASKVTIKQFTFYKFSYTLDNDDDTTIDVSQTAIYDSKVGESNVRTFAYTVTVTQTQINEVKEPNDDDYRDFDAVLVDIDDIVKKAFTTGVSETLSKALEAGEITTTAGFIVRNVTVSKLATVKKFTFYRFTTNVDNDDDTYIQITFTVVYSSKTDEYSVRRYAYKVSIIQTLINDVQEPADSDYQDVDLTLIKNAQIQSIFDFGVSELLSKAVQEGKIDDTNFSVKSTESYKTAVVKKFTFHRFAVTLYDGDETTLTGTVTVVHSSKNDENSLRRYNYQVTVVHVYVSTAAEPGDDQYTLVPLEEVDNTKIVQDGLQYAASTIIEQALADKNITATNFKIQSVVSCYKATVQRFTFYRYTFVLTNEDDTTIQVAITVVYDPKNGVYGYRRYSYNVTVTITLINEVQEPSDDQYTDLDVTTVDNQDLIKSIFKFGVQQLINKAYEENQITSTSFKVKSVTVVRTATVKNFNFYRFSFTLDDGDETTIDSTITVIHNTKDDEMCLRRYVYKTTVTKTLITDVQEPDDSQYIVVDSSEWESEIIISAYTYGYQEVIKRAVSEGKITESAGATLTSVTIVSIKRATVKNYVFYRLEITLESKEGTIMQTTITVIQSSKTGECSLRRYLYTITTVTTTTSTKTEITNTTTNSTKTIVKYKQIAVTEITESYELTEMVEKAVKWICQRLFKDGIIKEITFKIIRIDTCFVKYEGGIFYYKITVHIKNSYGLTLEVTFTCSYNIKTTQTIVIWFSITSSTLEIGQTICIDSPRAQEVSQKLLIGNFEMVANSEVEKCSDIRDALFYGVDLVSEQISQNEKLKDLEFALANVNTVYRQFMAGVNYRFNVDLENKSGDKVRTTFTVSSDHRLSSMWFVVYE